MGEKGPQLPASEWRHTASLAAAIGKPELLLSKSGRRYLQAKREQMGYAAAILADLKVVADAIASGPHNEDRLVNLLDIACWKARLSPKWSGGEELLAVEQALRARLGHFEQAAGQVDHLGEPDDRLIVNAELTLCKADQGPAAHAQHLQTIRSIAGECDPRTLEYVAVLISIVDLDLSIELARRLPMPEQLVNLDGEESPSRNRCFWRIFARLTERHKQKALSLLAGLDEPKDRLYASLGVVASLIQHDPPSVSMALDRALGAIDDPARREAIGRSTICFLGREASCLPVTDLLALLDTAHCVVTAEPTPVFSLIPVIDSCICRDMPCCVQAMYSLKSTALRDLLHWRIRTAGGSIPADACLPIDVLGSEFLLAGHAVGAFSQGEDHFKGAISAVKTAIAVANTFVLIAQRVEADDLAQAQACLMTAMHIWGTDESASAFYSRLEAIRALISSDGSFRMEGVRQCIAHVQALTPVLLKHQAAHDLGKVLAGAFGQITNNCRQFLSDVVSACADVALGDAIFEGLVDALSESACADLVTLVGEDDRVGQGITAEPSTNGRDSWMQHPVFVCLLATRAAATDIGSAKRLFLYAGRQLQTPTDGNPDRLAVFVLKQAIGSVPQIAWEVCKACGMAPMSYAQAASEVMTDAHRRSAGRRASWLRVSMEQALTDPGSTHWLEHTRSTARLCNDPLSAQLRSEQAPSAAWYTDVGQSFCEYIDGQPNGDQWFKYQLHDAVRGLARTHWQTFMHIVKDSDIADGAVHLLKTRDIQEDILALDLPPEDLLRDVLSLRKAKQWDPQEEAIEMRKIKGWLLACGASVAPAFAVRAVGDAAEPVLDEFLQQLGYVEPSHVWPENQVHQMLRALSEKLEPARAVVLQAMFIKWLAQIQPIESEWLSELPARARTTLTPEAQYEVARLLRTSCAGLAAELLATALPAAQSAGDWKAVLHICGEAAGALDKSLNANGNDIAFREAILRHWPGASDPGCERHLNAIDVAGMLARLDMRQDAEWLSVTEAAAQSVHWRGHADLPPVLLAIGDKKHVRPEGRRQCLQAVVRIAMSAGVDCTASVAESVSDVHDQVAILLQMIESCPLERRRDLLPHLLLRAHRLPPADTAATLMSIANRTLEGTEAASLYAEALQTATRHPNASTYIGCAIDVAGECISRADLDARRLSRLILKIAESDPFDTNANLICMDWKECSLMAAALCLWDRDHRSCETLLDAAVAQFAKAKAGHGTLYAVPVVTCYERVHQTQSSVVAQQLLQSVLERATGDVRQALCDSIVYLAVRTTATKQPLTRYHVWSPAIKPERDSLVDTLVPFCSKNEAAYARLAQAVTCWGTDRDKASRFVQEALELSLQTSEPLSHDFQKDLWSLYAAAHGVAGCFRALQEVLPDPDNIRLNVPGMISVAVEASSDPYAFLWEVWCRIRAQESS